MLSRVFLDTNVYIIGAADPESAEWQILHWLGFNGGQSALAEVVISTELIEQILRVARRLRGKDWAGSIVNRMWQNLKLRYVLINEQDFEALEMLNRLPREDIGVYLTAKKGAAECFVTSNHELIRAVVAETKDFQCLRPESFVNKYLSQ